MKNDNKQLISKVYSKLFGQQDLEILDSVIAEDYIQHNPMVKTGRAGFLEFLGMLKNLPKPEDQFKPFKRIISEGNFVAVHSQVMFMGKENAVVDLYRIENGCLSEHWDAVQEITSVGPVVKGSIEIDEQESTARNKTLVQKYVSECLADRKKDKVTAFLHPSSHIAEDFYIEYEAYELHKMIGEHNFVLTQATFIKEDESYVLYEIYRLSEGLIIDRWSVEQKIPDRMAHSNGMV